MKFKAKPLVIDAWQLEVADAHELSPESFPFWLRDKWHRTTWPTTGGYLSIDGVPGLARKGDWIIKDSTGKISICKPDVFEKTYEPVE